MENKVSINLFCFYSPQSFNMDPCKAYIMDNDNQILWEGTSNEIATFSIDKETDIKIIYKNIVMAKKWKIIFMALLWLLIIGVIWYLLYYKNTNNFDDYIIKEATVNPNENYDLRMSKRKLKVKNSTYTINRI